MKERFYHVRDYSKSIHDSILMTVFWIPKEQNSSSVCYHLHCDPDLSAGKVLLRKIPYRYESYIGLKYNGIENL